MINKTYAKKCDVNKLQNEIIADGLAVYPNSGFVFYGCNCDQLADDSWQTTVMCDDNISSGEQSDIDAVVSAHIPIPGPVIEPPVDEEGRTFIRAESKPTNMTTYFTSRGDSATDIGEGVRLQFDFNNDDDEVPTDSGWRCKVVMCSFLDIVRLKEGAIYWENMPFGSHIDLCLAVPDGAYYINNDGTVTQNNTGAPLRIARFVNDAPMMGSCPMGDELNTETSSNDIPPGTIFGFTVHVPGVGLSDNCHGAVVLELYRARTVILE